MDRYIGKMLDNRYEILECVGTGGMAVVYKARCHRLNRLVAVKILKPELANDADFRRRFHDESQAVAMLSHANIVSVYDVSHSDGLDYIVMELIDGMTLKQYMKKRGVPLNWREALHFITQIVRALGHAHSRGIIHRDIKPHNIMVLRDGSVKVADFGIARLASAAQATLTQEALGSVHYISPEQAKGSHVDGRTDLYSTGVVLYEMLTGRLPFEGETPVFVAIQHINSIPLAPRELNPEIPPALEAITMKAMAPNLENRYSSAEEMLAELKEFRKNPGMPLPVSTAKKVEPEVEEPTRVISVAGVVSMEKEPQKRPEERSAEQKPQQKPQMQRKSEPVRKEEKQPAKESVRPRAKAAAEEGEHERPRKRGVPPMLFAVLAILLVVCGIAYFLYTFLIQGLFVQPKEYKVPNFLGYTIEELERTPALKNGFVIIQGRTVYNEEYKEGQICDQSPAPGEMVKEGNQTITVTISGGEDNMFMIDVYGKDARQVLHTLQNEMGLVVRQEEEFNDQIASGYVTKYTPMEGTLLKPGDTVTIWISRGPEIKTVKVPNFVDMNIEQVKSQLEYYGLELGEVQEFANDEYPAGDVIWQSLDVDTEVEEGTVINFQVSKGTEDPGPSPTPGEVIILPSDDPNEVQSTRYVKVNLNGYTGTVNVRIVVGGIVIFEGRVESSVGTFEKAVTDSGTQLVLVYIDGDLLWSDYMEF